MFKDNEQQPEGFQASLKEALDNLAFNDAGLVAAIAQQHDSGEVLMMAWMNRESLALTAKTGKAVYWSRSRGQLWKKGESSGHEQQVKQIQLDCDGDTVLLSVDQAGGIACHTGRESCFFRTLETPDWGISEAVLKSPEHIYEPK
ncbi:MAG TPA: phosphoribosyl-AMP cyclohydrolase [Spongiibacteraceae bacterium]|nr:phosphoribosyl-AMP cyclohydrolase [Spongiibacteraceae bacterium]